MTADPGALRSLIPEVPTGTLDSDWIPVVAARGLAVVGRDRRIRTKPGERGAPEGACAPCVLDLGRGDLSTWDYLVPDGEAMG